MSFVLSQFFKGTTLKLLEVVLGEKEERNNKRVD